MEKKKVILITGASSGMGKETARQLIRDGHTVYAAARRIHQMQDLRLQGGIPIQMDITQEADIQHVVDTIIDRHGSIDVLWNNAGYGIYGAVEDIPLEDAMAQFQVNLFGLAALTKKVIPYMRHAESGTIINTSSMGGKMYFPLGAWYHASKHALEGFSDCLRLELKPFNIHVVVLEPGLIATEFGDTVLQGLDKISPQSAYRAMVDQLQTGSRKTMETNNLSPASVIADTVRKIIHSRRPKTRYRVGTLAKPLVWMRLYLGDRLFDKIISRPL